MSGICAVLHKDAPAPVPQVLRRVASGLALESHERVCMAHHRMTDQGCAGVAVAAAYKEQELFEGPKTLLACDADLFNESELQGLTGTADRGAGLLAALYEKFGVAFLGKLRGEYSIVLWDRVSRQLFAATDGFATRALAYYDNERVFLVASRIDALLASGETPREIRPGAVANYLNYTVNLAPGTIFKGISRILPGHYLLASRNQIRIEQYWDVRYQCGRVQPDEEALARRLFSAVEDSVKAHCKGEGSAGLGAFLSGGTDSSTVTGMMRHIGNDLVNTFSIGFAEERFNELEYARIAARSYHANHHEYRVSARDCAESIPAMVRYFDEPFGNSSAIPTYFCARLAAQNGVKTLLAGDGGDELFGGNERYLTDKIFSAYDRIPGIVRRGVLEPLLRSIPVSNGLMSKARSYVRRANQPQPERFFSYNLLIENPMEAIFEPDFVQSLNGHSVLDRPNFYYKKGPAEQHLDRLLYLDMKITLADNDLLKVTRMCEMAGVRPRFPYLDRLVAECSSEIPADLKVKGSQKRYLFKRAFRELLPAEIIRKKKQGFGIPIAVWMKTDPTMRELANDVMLAQRTYQRGYIRRAFIEDLMRRYSTDTTAFYGDILWTFLALELWLREFADKPRAGAA
jgi:asparagine synthase (glutamine-hydrolysing)